MREPLLAYMSWRRAGEYFRRCDVALLPVGSTEQHGPHNPLGTDHLVAYRLAVEAGRRTGALVLPVIPYGVSVHHSTFPGTIWVREEVFREYVGDVVRSLKSHGVRKVVVVNGHGGNLPALLSLSRELRREGVLMVIYQWWTAPGLGELFRREELGHAAAAETSLNLYLHPEAVDMGAAVDEEPRQLFTDGLGYYPEYTVDRTGSGVFGVSTTASRERGEEVFRRAVEALVKLVEAVKGAPEPRWPPPAAGRERKA
ncbi:MAG: creatininase family protein [Thermoprotei archaeon]|nr:MAG: creatininase family protein [Thermoprotei archaeon]